MRLDLEVSAGGPEHRFSRRIERGRKSVAGADASPPLRTKPFARAASEPRPALPTPRVQAYGTTVFWADELAVGWMTWPARPHPRRSCSCATRRRTGSSGGQRWRAPLR